MNAITTGYLVEIPGLAEAVARSTPAPTHQLLDGMRAFEALAKPLARSCRQSQRHLWGGRTLPTNRYACAEFPFWNQ